MSLIKFILVKLVFLHAQTPSIKTFLSFLFFQCTHLLFYCLNLSISHLPKTHLYFFSIYHKLVSTVSSN